MIFSTPGRLREISLILIIWGCFLARGFFYASIIPLWEGYDEWAHFAYAQHLRAHGTLPVGTDTRISREIEASLQLLPLPWEMRDFKAPHVTHDGYWQLGAEERADRNRKLTSIPQEWAFEPASAKILLYEAQQPPLYYWLLQWPLYLLQNTSLPERVYVLRYLSLLMASIVIPIGYLVARRTFHVPGIAFGVIAVMALMPEFILELSRVANDSLAAALYSLLLLLAFRILDNPERTRWSLAYGITLGLGLLTKQYFLPAIPATALLFLWLIREKSLPRRRILLHGCLIIGVAFVIAGWWYIRNRFLIGSWSGLQEDVALKNMSLASVLFQAPHIQWRVALDSFFVSHIYFGNWSFLQLRSWIYHFFRYLALIGVVGYLVYLYRCFRKKRPEKLTAIEGKSVHTAACFYFVFIAGLAYHVMITFATSGGSSTNGWYVYCLVIAELVLATAGTMAVLPARLHSWILPFFSMCFAALDLYGTHFVLVPYYTGLIAHKPNGALAAFHIGQIANDGPGLAMTRLLQNKPAFLSEPVLLLSWLLLLGTTVMAVMVGIRLRSGD